MAIFLAGGKECFSHNSNIADMKQKNLVVRKSDYKKNGKSALTLLK